LRFALSNSFGRDFFNIILVYILFTFLILIKWREKCGILFLFLFRSKYNPWNLRLMYILH